MNLLYRPLMSDVLVDFAEVFAASKVECYLSS